MPLSIEYNKEKSVFYWLKKLFEPYPFIKVVDSFPMDELKLPTISVNADELEVIPFEIGNRKGNRIRWFTIDIFASDKNQRDEYSHFILDNLEDKIPVYDFNSGYSDPIQIGVLDPISIKLIPLAVNTNLPDILYWRSQIVFSVEYIEI